MKTQEVEIMSENEERLVDILQQSFGRGTAKTLVYMLVKKKNAHTRDIERAMDLRQPEVSVGTKELRRLGILSKKEIPCGGKGRPSHLYALNKSVSDVKDLITGRMQEKIEVTERNLELLKNLLSERDVSKIQHSPL